MFRKYTEVPPLCSAASVARNRALCTNKMVGDGDESDPSVKWRGRSVDVAEAFDFPFESPPGGCLLRYNFLVQDGYELGFSMRCAICPALEGTRPGRPNRS